MLVLIAALVVILGFLAVLFRLVLGTPQNQDPGIGNNSPYPSNWSSDQPPYLPGPVTSEHQQILDEADRTLSARHANRRRRGGGSWMDVPGAMEADGLFDGDIPATTPSRDKPNPPRE